MSKESNVPGSSYVSVARANEVKEGSMFSVAVGGRPILLSKIGGKVYAMDAVCTHYNGYLPRGELRANHPVPGSYTLVCPVHKAQFDAITGRVVKNVSTPLKLATHKEATDLRTYEVQIVDDDVLIKV